jgi:hypothetical protein
MTKINLLTISCAGLAVFSIAAAIAAQQQNLPPLSSQYAPGTEPNGLTSQPLEEQIAPPVAGKPFRANFDSRRTEPDIGTREAHGLVARDSQGRVMEEMFASLIPAGTSARRPTLGNGYTIADPVARVDFDWSDGGLNNVVNKMAWRGRFVPPGPIDQCENVIKHPQILQIKRDTTFQDLGETQVQGIKAHGCRTTQVSVHPYDPNFPDEPSRTITTVEETWISDDLGVTVLHTRQGSQGIYLIERLDNIVVGEPNPALFNPPERMRIYDPSEEAEKAREMARALQIPIRPDDPSPAMIGGSWETADPILGAGTRIGIRVFLMATRNVQLNGQDIVARANGTYDHFSIRFFQRTAGVEQEEESEVKPPAQFSQFSWDGERLQGAFKPTESADFSDPEVGLNLIFDGTQQVWIGDYARRGVTKQVRLERPGGASRSDPLTGVWAGPMSEDALPDVAMGGSCVQISRSADGSYSAWMAFEAVDPRAKPGPAGMLPEVVRAGIPVQVTVENGTVKLHLAQSQTMSGGGQPSKFDGKLSPDGNQIVGSFEDEWVRPGGSGPTPKVMTRITPDGCIAHQARRVPQT